MAGKREQHDASFWEVSKVLEKTLAIVVAGVLMREIIAVMWKLRDLINIWPEEKTSKIQALDTLMPKPI